MADTSVVPSIDARRSAVAPRVGALTGRFRHPPRGSAKALGIGLLFVAPTFLFLAYFMYYPAYIAFLGAFTDWDGFNTARGVGFQNFRDAFADPDLRVAARNNVLWAVGKILLAVVPPFLAAELIFNIRSQRFQYFYRTLFVVPLVIPALVTILLWSFYYGPTDWSTSCSGRSGWIASCRAG